MIFKPEFAVSPNTLSLCVRVRVRELDNVKSCFEIAVVLLLLLLVVRLLFCFCDLRYLFALATETEWRTPVLTNLCKLLLLQHMFRHKMEIFKYLVLFCRDLCLSG